MYIFLHLSIQSHGIKVNALIISTKSVLKFAVEMSREKRRAAYWMCNVAID